MEPSLILAVLLSALLHALWNSFVKVGQDRLVSVAVICATGGALSAPVALLMPLPGATAFGLALLSVSTHLAYYFCLVNAYRFGDLSRVYPLARGLAPPLVAIGAALVAGERLNAREMIGVALVSLGIASLVVGARGDSERRGLWFASATGATIGIYTIIDGLGGRAVPRALSYIAWLNMLEGVVLLGAARARRGPAVWPALRAVLPRGVVAGVMATVGYGIVIYAMSRGAMAHVSALRETSVVIAALIGTVVLGEPGAISRVAAAAVVATGVIVLTSHG
ncbi:MAG TPA: DMT family transporter [Candidatus Dormibacteraeota bacterium]|nr:DMT family transporter [Candidatus Dormibacteraeota bacterium]